MSESYRDYLVQLAPPFLRGPNGTAYLEAHGEQIDEVLSDVKTAVKQRMPTECEADALPYIGSERQIDRGPNDTDETYAERLRRAWERWAIAGSPTGILLALYDQGYTPTNGAPTLVQQNGLAHRLESPDTAVPAGTTSVEIPDRDDLVRWITLLGPNPAIGGNQPLAAGVTEWWSFDATSLDAESNQYNGRFGLLFPELPSGWTTPTDPPVADPTLEEVNMIRRLVNRWRPGTRRFMGIWVLASGLMWGWPPDMAWGDPGLVWGGDVVNWGGAET